MFLDKEAGTTSFAALSALKRAAGTRKVGHTGTLDPFATGMLIALVGSATRTARYFNGLSKRYEATFAFGNETDTDDLTGETTAEAPRPSLDAVAAALDAFRGEIEQLPPSYSAVHVEGRRAHELARAGQTPELSTRRVTVERLETGQAIEGEGGLASLDVRIVCSAGTYIRSIARDLGRAVGSAAHVTALRRTAVGPFDLERAVTPAALALPRDLHDLAAVLPAIDGLDRLEVTAELARAASLGHRLRRDQLGLEDHGPASRLVLTFEGRAIAIIGVDGHDVGYDMVIPGGGPD